MRFASVTEQGMRPNNEDGFYVPSPGDLRLLAAVSDGMGGHAAGEVASRTVVSALRRGANVPFEEEDDRSLLSRLIRGANADTYLYAGNHPECRGMGATLACAALRKDSFLTANVGDSRIYLISDGIARQITEDQSYVQMLVREGRISREQALTHPRRSWILQAVGTEPAVQPDYVPESWREGDVLLLCSDGLSDCVTEEEIASVLRAAVPLQERVEILAGLALRKGARDNVTAVLVLNDGREEVTAP